MCAAGAHDYVRIIDGHSATAPVRCSRCGEPFSSVVIERLVEEVRNEKAGSPHYYNRIHNRHNRS